MKRLFSLLVLASAFLISPAPAFSQGGRELPDFADLVEKVGPAVVNIRTTERVKLGRDTPATPQMPEGIDENDPLYEFFRRFFPPRQGQGPGSPRNRGGGGGAGEEVPRGVGSGFIISADGFVLTNHHVVESADEIYVTLTDKRELRGKLIGSDKRTDVALVKIEANNLPKLVIGDSSRLRVGEWVLAIGSPFGLDNTVTAGIVSAKARDTGEYLPFIQTDVAVNPGNSGGPLINMKGEVVGINSQIYSRTGGFMGISFAIPIDEAMRVTEQLRNGGRVVRGRIGVGIAEVTKDVAEPLGLPKASGALVRNVESGSPADKAGIEPGDIITRFDGKTIEKSSDLPRIVGNTRPGSKAAVQVWRKGASRELSVTVGEMEPEKSAKAAPGKGGADKSGPIAANSFGITVSDLGEEKRNQLRLRAGIQIDAVDPSGPGAKAGLRPGDIIQSIDHQDMSNAKAFTEFLSKSEKGKTHILLVRRGDGSSYIPLRPVSLKP